MRYYITVMKGSLPGYMTEAEAVAAAYALAEFHRKPVEVKSVEDLGENGLIINPPGPTEPTGRFA